MGSSIPPPALGPIEASRSVAASNKYNIMVSEKLEIVVSLSVNRSIIMYTLSSYFTFYPHFDKNRTK